MALYRETDTKLCEDYFKGLPAGLQRTMITMEPMDRYQVLGDWVEGAIRHHRKFMQLVTDVPRGPDKRVRFSGETAIQDLRERAEKILAIRESEELAEEAVRLGHMVSSNAPLY